MIKNNLNKLLFLINSILLLLLLVSYIVPMVHPDYFWHISLLGIIFPILLILNTSFALYWIFAWKKYFWANLIIILLGLSHIENIIANQKNQWSDGPCPHIPTLVFVFFETFMRLEIAFKTAGFLSSYI